MASNLFSKLVPASQQRSFYEELRARNNDIDVEDQAGLALDEENLNHHFHDDDLDLESPVVEHSRATLASEARHAKPPPGRSRGPPTWAQHDDDGDNDVPASLLVEPHDEQDKRQNRPRRKNTPPRTTVPGPSSRRNRAQWEATRHQQRLHQDDDAETFPARNREGPVAVTNMMTGTAKQKAMWRWANVTNLDSFMQDVYDYYRGNGFWCILLDRFLHLIEIGFIAVFLTFLTQCVNYYKIPTSKTMDQILVPSCTKKMSGTWNFALWVTAFYWIWKALQIPLDMRRLSNMRDFYVHLLGIPEHDMQTVSWQDVVARIMGLRDQNPKTADRRHWKPAQRQWLGSQSKERLDAHDIANRLMRRENFLIALINKDVLDLSIPLPFFHGRQFLSRLLEWTLNFSIMDFVFDERGQVNQEFLKADRRGQLSLKLRARFLFAGAMTLVIAPFMAGYLFIMHFLTYFHEYHKNPSSLGTRAYTPLAEWKFREFNELPHIFQERVNMSYPFANRYLDQFPKVMTERLARTVAFIAGALATVLAIATMVDPDLFLGFEITRDRTALFYLTIFAGAWAFARGMIPEDNSVFDPEYALRQVIEYTHYEPDHWSGRLHSYEIKSDFSTLYKNKVVIFMEEIVSILIAPLILSISLPKSSDQIVDFFREFTIHVDGLGYVCSFAVFDFRKAMANVKQPDPTAADVREDYYSTKHGKMAASYYGFLDNYVINPKTGVPGYMPPSARQPFQPPPTFPGLQSPTLAADMASSRMGRSELGRDRSRARNRGPSQPSRPRGVPPAPSPMASVLLDPHHQPHVQSMGKSVHRPRQGIRVGGGGQEGIMEESYEDGNRQTTTRQDDDDAYESGHGLDQSEWQTSPAVAMGRDNSGVSEGEGEVGVLGLMYQFQREMKHK